MTTVLELRAMPHLDGGRVDLSWRNPALDSFPAGRTLAGIRIVRRERAFPMAPSDGVVVYPTAGPGVGSIITAFTDTGLRPLVTYYYTVFTADDAAPPSYYADERSRAACLSTKAYGLATRLYELLPAVHKRLDLPLSETDLATFDPRIAQLVLSLPPALRGRGQLWRFLNVAAAPLDLMRSFADVLRDLHDVDLARPEFLEALAAMSGWELDRSLPVSAQRNEVRFAPRLYRSVGTVPNVRAIANRYSGWYVQIAEFAQQIAGSNAAPELNVFGMQWDGVSWRGSEDAASLLGFTGTNARAVGSPNPLSAAVLTSAMPGPFALRPDLELAVTADARVPVVIHFRPGDFGNMSAASAAEVAAVVNNALTEISAVATASGYIELHSHVRGPDSSISVEQFATSLVTLEAAPRGRLATFVDQAGRLRLFYVVADPLEVERTHRARRALDGLPFPGTALDRDGQRTESARLERFAAIAQSAGGEPFIISAPSSRARVRTFRDGAWGRSYPLQPPDAPPQGDVATVELPDGRIFAAWLSPPDSDGSVVRVALGTAHLAAPARVVGERTGPFVITPGALLTLRGDWDGVETLEFTTALASPATAAAVVAFVNPRLRRSRAVARPDGRLAIESIGVGDDAVIAIDLDTSSAASALGFGPSNAFATGDAGDEISWLPAEDVKEILPGRHADLFAVLAPTAQNWRVRLFWARHDAVAGLAGQWVIVEADWNGTSWSTPVVIDDGDGGNREPCALLSPATSTRQPTLDLYWSQRSGLGTIDESWTLQHRALDVTADTWSPGRDAVTTVPPGGRVADREPSAIAMSSGTVVYFSSDRLGSRDLYSVGPDGTPVPITADAYSDRHPTPVQFGSPGPLWLLYRSDRSVPLSSAASRSLPRSDDRATYPRPEVDRVAFGARRSVRAAETGSLRRFAGSTTIVPTDVPRLARRRLFDDLVAYTPLRPDGDESVPLRDDDFYTQRTIGLYVSPLIPQSPLAVQTVARLQPVLQRFLPINVRAVVVLAPRLDIEFVYDQTTDILEAYQDDGFVEAVALADDAAVSTGWIVLLSNTLPDHLTAVLAAHAPLRHRSYFPPPE